uniref:Uncharacterized protein n=1 Tax=Glossina palpalis gambiensis TaxID=67801 RepID=A0A1B0AKP6_9MUSC
MALQSRESILLLRIENHLQGSVQSMIKCQNTTTNEQKGNKTSSAIGGIGEVSLIRSRQQSHPFASSTTGVSTTECHYKTDVTKFSYGLLCKPLTRLNAQVL